MTTRPTHLKHVMADDELRRLMQMVLRLTGDDIEERAIAIAHGWPLGQTPRGTMARKSLLRPPNYASLSTRERWAIDDELCILDWDGDPST